jgi:cell division septal protein FtsQ
MPEQSNKRKGWAIMFLLWNLGLLIAVIVLLVQLYQTRVDTKTIAKVCAEAAVSAMK